MLHNTKKSKSPTMQLMDWMLWPGDAACDYLNIEDPDSRMLLRMFINLTVYAKIAGIVVLALA